MTYTNSNRGLRISALNAYNKRRRAVLKILYKYGLQKNITNQQALEFIYKNLSENEAFFNEFTQFLIDNKFLENANGKRNFAIGAILGVLQAFAPALGNIGQGKRIDAQEAATEAQTQQEMLRLMQVQATVDAKKKQTQTTIAIAVIISVFALLAVIILKKK